MEKFKLIFSTSFGLFSEKHPNHWGPLIPYFKSLEENFPLEIEICLGSYAESILRSQPEVQDFSIHFSSREKDLLNHASDALSTSIGTSLVSGLHAPAPLARWEEWIKYLQKLEEEQTKFEIFSFSGLFPSPLPILVSDYAKIKMRRINRSGDLIKSRDFDWRFAENMADLNTSKSTTFPSINEDESQISEEVYRGFEKN